MGGGCLKWWPLAKSAGPILGTFIRVTLRNSHIRLSTQVETSYIPDQDLGFRLAAQSCCTG